MALFLKFPTKSRHLHSLSLKILLKIILNQNFVSKMVENDLKSLIFTKKNLN